MDKETTDEIKRYLDVTVGGLRTDLKADIRHVTEDLRTEIHDVKRHADVVSGRRNS